MAAIKKGTNVEAVHPVHGNWQPATAMHDSGMNASFNDPNREPAVWLEWDDDGYQAQQPLEYVEKV